MPRIQFPQQGLNLSDLLAEDAMYDSEWCGSLGRSWAIPGPDETSILRFAICWSDMR